MNWGAARGVMCVVACLAIQGCASVEQTAGDDAGAIVSGDQGGGIPQLPVFQPAVVVVDEPPPRPAPKPVRRARAKPTTEIARLPDPPPAEETPAPVVAPVPAAEPVAPKLVGLNEQELVATLGPPTERQELMPGKLWRYQLPGCTVSVSLYPEVQTMVFRSLSYEVTSNDDTPDGVRDCLSRRHQSLVSKQ
ncbi:MAG: hypothetical protein JNM30_06095 [Rhodospirillales bacterium]|nr:hypothetical protein [Rhodospirillales bacterium]